MAEKLVPLTKDGMPVEIAVAPHDFFTRKLARQDDMPTGSTEARDHQTYAEAGFALSDRYEDLSEYDGPKTQRAYERQQEDRRAERAAARAAEEKPAPAKAEAKKD